VVRQALRLRSELAEAFGRDGAYTPLAAEGEAADHVVAFLRGEEAITVAPRLMVRLTRAGGWRGTHLELPHGRWRDRLCGAEHTGKVPLRDLFLRFPVALLSRTAAP
jgi:(1->4)-alpha-D-glucan 1-alpha-D-glucosylmutase